MARRDVLFVVVFLAHLLAHLAVLLFVLVANLAVSVSVSVSVLPRSDGRQAFVVTVGGRRCERDIGRHKHVYFVFTGPLFCLLPARVFLLLAGAVVCAA